MRKKDSKSTAKGKCKIILKTRQEVEYIAGTGFNTKKNINTNRALMVIVVALAKEQNLLNQNVKWYQKNGIGDMFQRTLKQS